MGLTRQEKYNRQRALWKSAIEKTPIENYRNLTRADLDEREKERKKRTMPKRTTGKWRSDWLFRVYNSDGIHLANCQNSLIASRMAVCATVCEGWTTKQLKKMLKDRRKRQIQQKREIKEGQRQAI